MGSRSNTVSRSSRNECHSSRRRGGHHRGEDRVVNNDREEHYNGKRGSSKGHCVNEKMNMIMKMKEVRRGRSWGGQGKDGSPK